MIRIVGCALLFASGIGFGLTNWNQNSMTAASSFAIVCLLSGIALHMHDAGYFL